MNQDDDLPKIAGGDAGATENLSEADASPAAEKGSPPTPDEAGTEAKDANAGEDAGDKSKKLSGVARKKERIRDLEARIAELETRASAPVDEAKPPRLDDYPDWDSHQAALIQYAATNAIRESSRNEAKERLTAERQSLFSEQLAAHEARLAEARQRIPDYDKALADFRTKNVPIKDDLGAAILESDKSELLTYHLAQRPDLVRELNALSPVQVARRIGQIEARLSYTQPKKTTDAPPPVAGLKGGASSPQDPASLGHDEFKAMFARKKA